ncbi:UNVERIFIED_CONTAM: hypothetical protein GTU68_044801 [Idotea baltica]|nr:hypothetical protein [Idotea baltica]
MSYSSKLLKHLKDSTPSSSLLLNKRRLFTSSPRMDKLINK